MARIYKVLSFMAALVVVLVIFVWAFLSWGAFSGPRTVLASRVLAGNFGQDVSIHGDVRIGLGLDLSVTVEGLTLTSRTMPDVTVAEVGFVSFDLPLFDLWNGKPRVRNLTSDDVRLALIVDNEGNTSWAENAENDQRKAQGPNTPVSEIIADRAVRLTSISVLYKDARNGLDLTLDFADLTLDRGNQTTAPSIVGQGALNGEAFEFSGSYSETQTFNASVDFADITLNLTETTSDKGFEIALAADVREFGQLQDALRFTRVLEGKGTVGLVFSRFDGVSRIDDLDVQLALEEGQSLSVTGQVGELGKPDDVQLVTKIRLYPEDATPPATTTRYDLKLVAIEMVMHAVPGQIPQRSMVIETNGFTLDTAGEGPPPISVRGLSRTENGALRIGNVHLRIGPTDKPFVILDGSVGDALQLAEIEVSGVMDVTAGSLIGPQLRDKEEILGGFKGDFLLTGSAQELSLSDLDASTTDTDLWTLKVTGSVRNVLKFEGLTLDVDVAVPSGAELMEAMEIKPIDTGVAHLALAVKSQGTDWSGKGLVTLGKSGLNLTLEVVDVTNDPVVRGLLESDLILVQELRHIFAAAIELRELGERIPAPEDEDPPPVLRNVTLKPIGRAVFLSGMDLDVDIDLRKIEGSSGVNSLESEVTIKDSLLNVGPLKFNVEGAAFDVHGSMDLAQETYPLTLKGTAGGWKLHDLLEFMNFRKAASGTFYTNFDVTGKSDSVKNFLATMTGHATLSMRNGSIETQLLDIAGLGVLPWLFSENKEKIVPIVCMNAPFTLSNGVISTDDTTLETNLVQVIAFGKVGLGQRTIDMSIQPRKIGEPLSRSPWPVTLTGALTDPNVKVKDGPRRLKRADGANQMPAERKLCVPDILQLQ